MGVVKGRRWGGELKYNRTREGGIKYERASAGILLEGVSAQNYVCLII